MRKITYFDKYWAEKSMQVRQNNIDIDAELNYVFDNIDWLFAILIGILAIIGFGLVIMLFTI